MAPLHILIESENVELIKVLLLFKNIDVNLEMISLAILLMTFQFTYFNSISIQNVLPSCFKYDI